MQLCATNKKTFLPLAQNFANFAFKIPITQQQNLNALNALSGINTKKLAKVTLKIRVRNYIRIKTHKKNHHWNLKKFQSMAVLIIRSIHYRITFLVTTTPSTVVI